MKKGELALNVQGLVTGVFYIIPVHKVRDIAHRRKVIIRLAG